MMDINNSMAQNNNSFKSSKKKQKTSVKSKKSLTKNTPVIKSEITCEKDTKTKFDISSEEFSIHIIDCDDCLKKLFLRQAKMQEKQSELLLEKTHKKKKNKNKRGDLNNSMEVNLNKNTHDTDESEENEEEDEDSEQEKDIDDKSMLNIRIDSFKKSKKKKIFGR